MRKPTRVSLAVFISAGALATVLSAPAAFAEKGHGGRGGHGSDDVVTTTTTHVSDVDIHDDRGRDAAKATAADAVVHDRDDVADDND